MNKELQELIDLIEIKEKPLGKEDQIKVKLYMSGSQITKLCKGIIEKHPATSDGWNFFYNYLTVKEVFKIYYFLDRFSQEKEVSYKVQLVCGLTSTILEKAINLPCELAVEIDEQGYLEVIENRLEFYLPMDEFEKAHTKTHSIIKMILSHVDIGGFTHAIREN